MTKEEYKEAKRLEKKIREIRSMIKKMTHSELGTEVTDSMVSNLQARSVVLKDRFEELFNE